MAAFDLITKTIHHEGVWDKGEEVVIKEPTYGENLKMTAACTKPDGELDAFKLGDMMLINSIVSWTFKRNGQVEKIDLHNIKSLPTSYVTFIAEQIGEFTIVTDADFPGQTGSGT